MEVGEDGDSLLLDDQGNFTSAVLTNSIDLHALGMVNLSILSGTTDWRKTNEALTIIWKEKRTYTN